MSHPPKALPLSLKENPPISSISFYFPTKKKKKKTSVGVCLLTASLNVCEEQRAFSRSCPLARPLRGKENKRPCSTSRLNVIYPHRPLEGALTRMRSPPPPTSPPAGPSSADCLELFMCVFGWPTPFNYRFRKRDRKW